MPACKKAGQFLESELLVVFVVVMVILPLPFGAFCDHFYHHPANYAAADDECDDDEDCVFVDDDVDDDDDDDLAGFCLCFSNQGLVFNQCCFLR